ncbi:MAG: 3-deoxy-manno-octulosonate cytidylyltransferase [Deltaproteobacteria bacterium]|nr:3-deoxy-manno-octulosonate cytidylyltransferase [Deltaproteobacteria bacterium]
MKTSNVKIAAIIPARMASARLPGKPLLEIEGLPMIEHVRRRVLLSGAFSDVVVATCDREIAEVVEKNGGRVMMTSIAHKVATERIVEAMQNLDCTHVMNVQGDEILVLPGDLAQMAEAIRANPSGASVWNAIARITEPKDLMDTAIVKCVVSKTDRLLFCSRKFLFSESVFQVVGILAYQRKFLEEFSKLNQTPLELLESVEQSRILEHDMTIQGVRFEKGYPGINTPVEAETVKLILKEDPIQRSILLSLRA